MRKYSQIRRLAVVVAVSALVLGACSSDSDDATDDEMMPATVSITATDDGAGGGYGFDVPATVEAGAAHLSLANTGTEQHHAQLFKLAEGKTMDDLGAAFASAGDDPVGALLAVGTFEGGTGVVEPGSTAGAEAVVDLTEGSYVLMCFVENANGPHVAQGMLAPFEVTAAETPVALHEADDDVGLVDYGFELPDTISGDELLQITNNSQSEAHEMNFVKLDDGKTIEDFQAFAAAETPEGPPPGAFVGGMQALLPGTSEQLSLNLEPGEYIVVCFIPSVVDGVPHVAKGMVQQVTIS